MQNVNRGNVGLGKTGILFVFLAAVGYVACYNPNVPDGLIVCSPVTSDCPEGFSCLSGKCHKGKVVSTGGVTGQGGVVGTGGVIGSGGVKGAGGTGGSPIVCAVPVGPLPGCKTPANSTMACNPACQSGCGCNEQCVLSGEVTMCQPDKKGTKALGQSCGGDGPTVFVQDCKAGNTCLEEYETVCGKHCFRYCNDDTDCAAGAHCTTPLIIPGDGKVPDKDTGVKVCDNPPEQCSPVFGNTNCNRTDRPSPAFGCYLMGRDFPDQAVCDCAGTTVEDAPCRDERECLPGLICVGQVAGRSACKRVCSLKLDVGPNTCGVGRTCKAVQGSVRWGICS
jgi:hypothetical protein